jgi:16S rRNA (cytidine1402-2'-O)-methyltransferase
VPGASAVIAALSIAGLPTDRFVFEGFLPTRAGEQRHALERLRREPRTIVCYEAARRLAETLEGMVEAFGRDRVAVVLREVTKTYEEMVRGTLGELADRFEQDAALGEVTIVIEGSRQEESGAIFGTFDEAAALEVLRDAGLSLKDASAALAKLTGLKRRDLYQRGLNRDG